MSDSAKDTWKDVPSTEHHGTTFPAPEASPLDASYAIGENDSDNGETGVGEGAAQPGLEGVLPAKPINPKCFDTDGSRNECLNAVSSVMVGDAAVEAEIVVVEVKLMAQGGYNDIWLVTFLALYGGAKNTSEPQKFIVREPNEDALCPHQIENEVAWLTFLGNSYPSIPVPKVYAHKTRATYSPYIAMEYAQGEPLSSVWKLYSESEKWDAARSIADTILDLAGINFDCIGGLTLEHKIGPTVEGVKLFKGRDKFHSSEYYDIGPYPSTRDYILAYYDKEIYYYTHASDDDIDWDLFEKTSRPDFMKSLQCTRDDFAASTATGLPDKPFVVVHGDLQGRNIMMLDKRISAILDWEFAGAYPVSEVLGTGIDVLEMESEEDMDEDFQWSHRIADLVEEGARERGWGEERVQMMIGESNADLDTARTEMFPLY